MLATAKGHAGQFLWSYVLGPFLALLPSRWRAKWFTTQPIHWRSATIISGIVQFFLAPLLLLLWASGEVCSLEKALGFGCGGGELQTFSVVAIGLNPVTWFFIYLIFEGAGRAFSASMLGEMPGTLALVAPDWLYLFIKKKLRPAPPVRPDLITQDDLRADWQLMIASSLPKRDWEAGRLLRYNGNFYRIESCAETTGLRPFVYQLRRLAAGFASRSVILYSPEPPAAPPLLSPQKR
jgi:hypothetical protein